jgi:hypothetical protein
MNRIRRVRSLDWPLPGKRAYRRSGVMVRDLSGNPAYRDLGHSGTSDQ